MDSEFLDSAEQKFKKRSNKHSGYSRRNSDPDEPTRGRKSRKSSREEIRKLREKKYNPPF